MNIIGRHGNIQGRLDRLGFGNLFGLKPLPFQHIEKICVATEIYLISLI